jgi:hypothetical protein
MGSLRFGCTTTACRLALLACLALVLGGCGLLGTSHYHHDPAVIVDAVDCQPSQAFTGQAPSSSAPRLSGSIPEGFVPVKLALCAYPEMVLNKAGETMDWTVKQTWLTGDLGDVVAALAIPSDRNGRMNCTADMEIPPTVWLVNADGQVINVAWPLDACGKSKKPLREALAALSTGEVETITAPPASK